MLPIHPLANLLPAMTQPEFDALKADIAANGQREPIVLLDEQILDGRMRAAACDAIGVPPATVPFDSAWGAPAAYVYSRAIRRNLTESQKAAVAVLFADELAREAKHRSLSRLKQNAASDAPPALGKSGDIAGALFGVSGRYVQDAKLVRGQSARLFADVLAGRLTLPRAKRLLAPSTDSTVRIVVSSPRGGTRSLTVRNTTVGEVFEQVERAIAQAEVATA